jgi:Ca2+-binding EF-hand superfamily protein
MQVSALVQDVTIRAKATGVAETAAATERLGEAADQAAAATDRLERRQLSVDRAYDRLQRQIDATYRQTQMFEQGQRTVERAFEQGRISTEAYERSLSLLRDKYGQVGRAAAAMNDNVSRAQNVFNQQLGVRADFGTAGRGADIAAYGSAIDALRAKYVPLAAAQQQYRASLTEINMAARAGALSEAERALALAKTKEAFAAQVVAMRGTVEVTDKYRSGVGLARHELVNLSRQAQDVFVSLASGQAPLTVLIQQGTQIADVFASSQGSVGGFFRQLLAGLLPLAPVILGVAGALTGLYAAFSVSGERRELSNSLLGIGAAAGISGSQLDRLAVDAARAADVTVSSARQMATEFTRTGRIAPDVTAQLIRVSKGFALAMQQDLLPASKELAGLLSGDLSKAAETLNQRLGAFDGVAVAAIRRFEAMGERGKAQKLIIDGVAVATAQAEQSQSAWNRAIDTYLSKPFDRLKEGLAGFILGKDDATRAAEDAAILRKQIDGLQNTPIALRPPGVMERHQAELAVLERRLKVEQDIATAQKERVDRNLSTARGQELINADPTNRSREQLNKDLNTHEHALADLSKAYQELSTDAGRNSVAIAANLAQQRQHETLAARTSAALKDVASMQRGVTIETERDIRTQKLREAFVGRDSLRDQAEMAMRQKQIDLFGSEISTQERAAAAKRAYDEVITRGQNVAANQAETSRENTDASNAQAEAYRNQGVAAGELAKIEAQARRDIKGTGEDNPEGLRQRVLELTMETAAKVRAEIARGNAELRGQVEVSQRVNQVAQARGMSEERIARLQQQELEKSQLIAKLRGAGMPEDEVTRQVAELVRLRGQELSIEKERQALNMIASQRDSIEMLQLEVSLLGKSTEERMRAVAVLKAEQALRKQGIDPASDLGRQYVDGAKLEASLTATKDRFVDLSKDLTSILGGVFDDLFTKTDKGFEGVVDNALKSFARLGTRLIENQILKPLMSGQGLGNLLGSAANDNGSLNVKPLTDSLERGASGGIIDGFKKLGSMLFGGGAPVQGPTQNGATLDSATGGGGFSFGGVAGLGVAGLAGFGMGQQSQSPLIGGIGGALSGFAAGAAMGSIGGPIGAVIGGAAGVLGGMMGQSAAKKQRRQEMMAALKQYQDDWAQIQPDVERQRALWRGETEGGLTGSFREARTNFQSAAKTAQLAGDKTAVFAMERDLQEFLNRSVTEFRRSFAGTLDALNQGFGLNSPFLQASKSVKDTGEALKGFVADTQLTDGAYEAAREASRTYAMTLLTGAREIGAVEAEIQRINGTASSLSQVLVDLGMSADAAAEAVEQGVVVAMEQLRASFERDLDRKTLSALDRDHINETADLFAEVERLRADAALLGTDQARVSAYFQAAAQKIVNGADLTGAAFDDLIARFPSLAGLVVEAGQAIGEAAREIEAAKRRLGYQDRLFAALNDSTTLDGQLAAFDRSANRQRLEEMRAGGQAINDLEAALAAERLKIIETFADQAAAEQKRALQEAQNFFDGFTRNLRQFVDNMRAGNDSPLSPEARLAAAQSQYNAQLALAQGGNRDAINGLTGYASSLLDAAKGFHASSPAFQAIFEQVAAQLTALPTQVSAEQFIVDAIEDANTSLLASLARLDTNGDGMISLQEAANSNLAAIFSELDTNGDGQISRLELIRAAAQGTDANTEIANTLLQQVQALGGATNSLMESSNSMQQSAVNFASTQNGLLGELISLNTTSLAMLNALNRQFSLDTDLTIRGVGVNNNMVTALNKIAYNTAFIMQYTGNAGGFGTGNIGAFASGGWINGPGSPTSDSVPIWASNGEFMVNAAAASRHASLLEAINGGASFADLATFSQPRPAAGPVFVPPANQNDGSREIVAELRRLHARIEQLEQRLIEAEYGSAGVVAGEVAGVRQEQRRAAADARQDRNRPDRAGKRVA